MEKVESSLGKVDLLVNNAAYVAPLHQFAEGDPSQWDKMLRVNVMGVLNMTHAVLPGMISRKQGKLIFMSSRAGRTPTARLAVHSGTKHFVEGFVGALEQEIAGTGVSVSVVRPGGVATPGYDHATNVSGNSSVPDWIPTSSSSCLDPKDVARTVVGIVDIMDTANVREVSIAACNPANK